MKQGSIILVPFPFTDLSSVKTRPALVVSRKNDSDDYIVVAITSKKSAESIQIKSSDLSKGLLPLTSFIRYGKIVTLHSSLIRREVAVLKKPILEKVIKKVRGLF